MSLPSLGDLSDERTEKKIKIVIWLKFGNRKAKKKQMMKPTLSIVVIT